MFPTSPSSILIVVLLQGSPLMEQPAVAACEELRRIELSLVPAVSREICVSPGLMTGFRVDVLVTVEVQDEVRFEEVVRGRQLVTLVPPADMAPGERLRLTMHFEDGAAQQSATFTLVAHRGQATRQVEVYRDRRTRESFQQELDHAHAKNQRLREENQELRARLERSQGLRSLIANMLVGRNGVPASDIKQNKNELLDEPLSFIKGVSYRTQETVVAEVWLKNSSAEPWMVAGASLVDAAGRELKGMKLLQKVVIQPNMINQVVVEVDASPEEALGEWKLTLWDATRTIILPDVSFP